MVSPALTAFEKGSGLPLRTMLPNRSTADGGGGWTWAAALVAASIESATPPSNMFIATSPAMDVMLPDSPAYRKPDTSLHSTGEKAYAYSRHHRGRCRPGRLFAGSRAAGRR